MKQIALQALQLYQKTKIWRPARCRFYPSCSCYATGCIERFGLSKGLLLTVLRLGRCHPFHSGGIDDVPERFPFLQRFPIGSCK